MMKKPTIIALLVFLSCLAVGTTICFALDLFPDSVVSPRDQGCFVGQVLGVPALLIGVAAWFAVRRQLRLGTRSLQRRE